MNMNLLNKSEQKKKQDLMQIKDRWQIKNRFSIKNVNTSKCKRNQVPISDINTFEQQIFFEKILCSNIDFLLFTIKNYSNRFLFNFYQNNLTSADKFNGFHCFDDKRYLFSSKPCNEMLMQGETNFFK